MFDAVHLHEEEALPAWQFCWSPWYWESEVQQVQSIDPGLQ